VAERTRGMGRGLAAILASSAPQEDHDLELRDIPLDLIAPNPNQPRKHFEEGALVALADSLRDRGVLQPVLVRPVAGGTYEIIAGERRWRAALLAGFDSMPALVRPHDDAESLELALIENMAREDLNPVEEARACALLTEELGLTREELGRRIGRSRVAVSNLLRLLDLPDEVLDLLATRQLSEGHGRAVLMTSDHDERRRIARTAAAEGWSVRETENRARAVDESLDSGGGAAPRRSGHPDQVAAALRIGEVFGRALGTDVKVRSRGTGYRLTLTFDSLDEALAAAARLSGEDGYEPT
jgi:ParB family transcriptional regulator, chromosome partitioning protein